MLEMIGEIYNVDQDFRYYLFTTVATVYCSPLYPKHLLNPSPYTESWTRVQCSKCAEFLFLFFLFFTTRCSDIMNCCRPANRLRRNSSYNVF